MPKRPLWPGWEPSRGKRPAPTTLLARFRALWITPAEIRRETWALGGRHQGEVLVGARLESQAPGLSFRRAILLKAVIRTEGLAAEARGQQPESQPLEEQP